MNIEIGIKFDSKKESVIRKNKEQSLLAFPDNYTVFDIETTGLDPKYDEIIEIGALKIRNNKIIDQFSFLIKPTSPIDEFIAELTGITNEMVSDAPNIKEILPKFLEFIGDDILIGHNINFDINFVYDNLINNNYKKGLSNDFIDTLRLGRGILKELKHHRLKDLAEYYEIDTDGSHRSLKDCEITNEVFKELKSQVLKKFGTIENFANSFKTTHSGFKASDIVAHNKQFDEDNFFYKKNVAITGTLERILRKDAMQIIADLGGFCEDRVTQKTNCLILGNNDYNPILRGKKSSKLLKAEQMKLNGYDIEIMSENVFYDLISDELKNVGTNNQETNEIDVKLANNTIFNNAELKMFNDVKKVLLKNGKDVSDVRCVINSNNNFSILLFGELLRTKLRGRENYIVVSFEDIKKYNFSSFDTEPATSADCGNIRLIINNDFNINILENYIIDKYDKVKKDNYEYIKNVKCGQKNYDEYLKVTYK